MTSATLDADTLVTISTIRRACTDGRLRAAMAEAKISGGELAQGLNSTHWSVSRWLNGHDVPSAALALRLAAFLDRLGVGISE